MLPPDVRFKGQNAPKSISVRGPLWGSLQRFPNPLTGFKGATSHKGRGREGEWREGQRRGRKGKGGAPALRWYGTPKGYSGSVPHSSMRFKNIMN